jgi:hypothetical protein
VLPQSYEVPVAIALVLGGAIACFAGHRLFRLVLGIYGFILGAMLASSVLGVTNTLGMVLAGLAGGLVGAVVLVFAYFVGIALVGAGLAALAAHLVWERIGGAADPPPLAIIIVSVAGAIAAMLVQRYVIVVGTAFAGAWTLLLGSLALVGNRAAARVASADVWILYPFSTARWVPYAWIGLGLVGTIVQLWLSNGRKR